ncbi:MAG: DNA recombination protein RmuC [Prevotellaceae bacterium]|nr:DNA recombination protein RmuC [Candidatus Minthosoma equi]
MEIVLYLFIGLIGGLVAGFIAAKMMYDKKTNDEKADFESMIANIKSDAEKHCQEIVSMKEKSCAETLAIKDKAYAESLAAQEARHKEMLDAQQRRFDETLARVTAEMKGATEEMLKQRQKEFSESSNMSLGQIVNPLRETIDKMKKAMDENTMQQSTISGEMRANVENMLRQSAAAQKSAEELTRVFKHGNKVQGDWGETVLDEILQSQGLTQGIHYDTQPYLRNANGEIIKSEDGSMMRPDVILHLDTRREVIIDSKVSLKEYIEYVNAEDEGERQNHLKEHIKSIQRHVQELSTKDYSSYVCAPKMRMDYVIMFVPHSGALWTALNAQPDLWRKAMEKNVFIADEQTLYAAIKIVNLTWTQISQAQNHEKVFALANEMVDRVGQFMKKYSAIGKALDAAQKAYEDGEKKLLPQGQSILQTCGKLTKMGAKISDKNPINLLSEE